MPAWCPEEPGLDRIGGGVLEGSLEPNLGLRGYS